MQDNSYKNIVFLSKLEVLHALRNRKYSKNNALHESCKASL
jgi:hypothetical protein